MNTTGATSSEGEEERTRGYLEWLMLDELVTSGRTRTVQQLLRVFEDAGKALDPEQAEISLRRLEEAGAIERAIDRVRATKTAVYVMGLPDVQAR